MGREIWGSLSSPRILGFSATIAISTVLMGPFGTFSAMSVGERLLVWPTLVLISVILGVTVQVWSRRVLRGHSRILLIALEAVVLGAMMLPIVILWIRFVAGPSYEFFLSPGQLFGVVAIAYAMTAATLGYSDPVPRTGLQHMGNTPPKPKLYDRLAEQPSAPIIHLTADDHYVKVTTADGATQRVLIRLADAVKELDGVDGFCVHRSHWVGRRAIASAFREKGRDFVRLHTGTIIPVSKTYRPNLVKAGVLDERV